jgi:hypothetical protein
LLPCASYFAGGLVITSILEMSSDEIDLRYGIAIVY